MIEPVDRKHFARELSFKECRHYRMTSRTVPGAMDIDGGIFRPRNKISQMVNYSDRDPGIDVSTSFAIVVWARLQGRGGWAWKVSARSI